MRNRAISPTFLDDLKSGELKAITEIIKIDPSLDLEMRGNCVMVYYRGGKLLTINDIKSNPRKDLLEGLDPNYSCNDTIRASLPIPNQLDILGYFAKAKSVVDNYLLLYGNKLGEKEIQQRVVYENNYSINADETDFFITDMEWAENLSLGGRADLIAFQWGHMSHKKRKLTLYMIEVKQGCNAIRSRVNKNGKLGPGLLKHYRDFEKFVSSPDDVAALKSDMLTILRQKYELGLIDGLDDLFTIRSTGEKRPDREIEIEDNVEFVYILANYLKYSQELKIELEKIPRAQFFEASLMGYGLYKDFIVNCDGLKSSHPDLFK